MRIACMYKICRMPKKKKQGLSSKGECRHTFDAEDQLLAKK
jgi:hypothetical protein